MLIIIKDKSERITEYDSTSNFFLLCLSTFIISKKGNIFSSGTPTTTSAPVRKRKKEEKEKHLKKRKFKR
jgi:hypothetical protein